jgi:hypothetical protein
MQKDVAGASGWTSVTEISVSVQKLFMAMSGQMTRPAILQMKKLGWNNYFFAVLIPR